MWGERERESAMWSSIENLKENLNKIALDVHEDDEYEDDLLRYGTANGVGDLPDYNRRNSRSVSRYPISNGIESPNHHEVFGLSWISSLLGSLIRRIRLLLYSKSESIL